MNIFERLGRRGESIKELEIENPTYFTYVNGASRIVYSNHLGKKPKGDFRKWLSKQDHLPPMEKLRIGYSSHST